MHVNIVSNIYLNNYILRLALNKNLKLLSTFAVEISHIVSTYTGKKQVTTKQIHILLILFKAKWQYFLLFDDNISSLAVFEAIASKLFCPYQTNMMNVSLYYEKVSRYKYGCKDMWIGHFKSFQLMMNYVL